MSETPVPAPAPAASVPGKTLGIVGLILAFLAPLIGLILSIVARSQSKAAGVKNGPATAGIVLSIIFMVLWILIVVLSIAIPAALLGGQCAELGPGVHDLGNGTTITCG